jgi:hypothetical protein
MLAVVPKVVLTVRSYGKRAQPRVAPSAQLQQEQLADLQVSELKDEGQIVAEVKDRRQRLNGQAASAGAIATDTGSMLKISFIAVDDFASSMVHGGEVSKAVGFIEREMPRIGAGKAAACARRMRLESAGSEQDPHSFAAKGLDASAERGAVRQCRVDEGKHDDRDTEPGDLR